MRSTWLRTRKKHEFRDDDYHGWWGDAAKDNTPSQRRHHEEVATLSGQPAVGLFFEFEKLCPAPKISEQLEFFPQLAQC